jgi:hypothetical protein
VDLLRAHRRWLRGRFHSGASLHRVGEAAEHRCRHGLGLVEDHRAVPPSLRAAQVRARHGVHAAVVATLGPRDEHKAALDVSRAPSGELAELAHGRPVGVQAVVAHREDAPPATLASLARRSLSRLFLPLQRPARIVQNGASLDEIVLRNVLVNPYTPARTLARFGRAAPLSSLWVVQSVASNSSTPATVLRRLANHREVAIRWTVAGNPSTPGAAVRRLGRSDDAVMRWFLSRHHVVPSHELVEGWRQIERWRCARHTDRMSRSSWIRRASSTWRSESRRLAIH